MHRRVRASEHDATFKAVWRSFEAEVADLHGVARTTECKVGLSEIDERWGRRVAAYQVDQLLDFLSRGPTITLDHQHVQGNPIAPVAANLHGAYARC